MLDIDSFVLIAIVVYVLAGMVKGTIGIGLPTTAVSLMAQVTDARSAVTLVVIPMFVTNLWQVIRSGRVVWVCLLYTSPSPRDRTRSRMPSSA